MYLENSKTIVVKIGSSLIIDDKKIIRKRWITFFPAIFLVILAFSINLLGDWMRDTLNPKLKK